MVLFRWLFLMMALSFVVSLGAYTVTRDPVWRQRAMAILKWTIALGLGFFGLLILRRAAIVL